MISKDCTVILESKRRASRTTKSWLGATEPVGTLPIVIFVPGQDRDGNDIDHDLVGLTRDLIET